MIRKSIVFVTCLFTLATSPAHATIFGSLRGIVHDPHHRPVSGAMVMLRSQTSDWEKTATTDNNGEFQFNALPLGEYSIVVVAPGFSQASQKLVVQSGTEPVLHLELRIAAQNENVTVSAAPEAAPTDSATPTTLVDRAEIAQTPGAARSNSNRDLRRFVLDRVEPMRITGRVFKQAIARTQAALERGHAARMLRIDCEH